MSDDMVEAALRRIRTNEAEVDRLSECIEDDRRWLAEEAGMSAVGIDMKLGGLEAVIDDHSS